MKLPSSLLLLALVTGSIPARAADGDVTVHEFDPQTGIDAKATNAEHGVLYVNPGPIVSLVGGRQPVIGVGGELSAMYYPRATWQSPGLGGFAQAQVYDGKYGRFALGGQACLASVGVELGLAYRQGDDSFASTFSVHGAIFLSAGFLVMSLRDTLPLNGFGDHLGFGSETAFTFALKVPLIFVGHDKTGWALFGND
jgi:hypothetical protein